MKPIEKLMEMLEFRRPAFTAYEEAFINRYIMPYNPKKDTFGNLIIDVGSKPEIIWSSHTDTVHHSSGLQTVFINKKNEARVRPHKQANCLGADCTTGVWIMLEMLEAGVEGRYIFHRDEESGGNGSKWIAKNSPDLLTDISAAIAFDRKGTNDVITHQGGRTASDKFAKSVSEELGAKYSPSAFGMFTDTKNYAFAIPECTNISVGYSGAHSANEAQDLTHALWLRNKMMDFKTTGLVIARTPAEPVREYYSTGYSGMPSYERWRAPQDMFDLVKDYPTTVSRIMELHGWDFDTLQAAIIHMQAFQNSKTTSNATLDNVAFLNKPGLTKPGSAAK